jgi:hypothetical protein
MQLLLAMLCVLMILFAGGCALITISVGAVPLAVIPGGIVALNVLVILALRGTRRPSGLAFGILAILDLLIGGVMLASLFSQPGVFAANRADPRFGFDVGFMALAGGLLLKGLLTLLVGWRLGRRGPGSGGEPDRGPDGAP